MGLDSVELVYDIEKYFGITIPDHQSEQITTIHLMVEAVAGHLNVVENGMELRNKIFEKIKSALPASDESKKPVQPEDLLIDHLAFDKVRWRIFQIALDLEAPKPEIIQAKKTNKNRIISFFSWQPMYDPAMITMEQFIAAVCAMNYKKLIDNKNIKSKYEIYIAVAALTVEKSGVEYYEIGPEKSFVNDLGID